MKTLLLAIALSCCLFCSGCFDEEKPVPTSPDNLGWMTVVSRAKMNSLIGQWEIKFVLNDGNAADQLTWKTAFAANQPMGVTPNTVIVALNPGDQIRVAQTSVIDSGGEYRVYFATDVRKK